MRRSAKIYYSIGRMGSTGLLSAVTLVTFYYYNFRYHLNPFLNGLALATGNIAIILSSIIVGYASDRLENALLGRRKYFIFTGSILLAVSFFMIFIPHLLISELSDLKLFIYESIWVSLFYFFYGYLTIPHLAMLPEISNGIERVELSAYLNLFNIIGNGFGVLVSGVFVLFMTDDAKLIPSLILVMIIETALYVPLLAKIEEAVGLGIKRSFIEEIRSMIRHKRFMIWNFAQGITEIGITIFTTLVLVYLRIIGLLSSKYIIHVLIAGIFFLASYLLWPRARRRFKTKVPLMLSIIIIIFGLSLTPIILLSDIALVIVLSSISSGLLGYWIYRYVIVADLVDEVYGKDRVLKSAFYYGINNVFLNIFLSIGHALAGIIASLDVEIWTTFFGYFIIPFMIAGVMLLYLL